MIESITKQQNKVDNISNQTSKGFNSKLEWHFVKCPYCNKVNNHTPRGLKYSNYNNLVHKCRHIECRKQFRLSIHNSVKIFNQNPKEYENSIFYEILNEIGLLGNHLKKLKSKYYIKKFYLHLNYLYENSYIVYDLFRIDEITTYFKISFLETITTYDAVFNYFLPSSKNKKLTEKLRNLKRSDFSRLGNIKISYQKVKKGFLIEIYKKLQKCPFGMDTAIRKKINNYIIEQLKSKEIKNSVIPKNSDVTCISTFKTDKYREGKLRYDLEIILNFKITDNLSFGHFFKYIDTIELEKFKIRIHEISIKKIRINNDILSRLNAVIIGNGTRISGDYWTLSTQNGAYLQLFICNNVSGKKKDRKANLDLINAGINGFVSRLFKERFNFIEIYIILHAIFSYEINVETGFRVLTPERSVLSIFELGKRYELFGKKFWFDRSLGYLEMDTSTRTSWSCLFNLINCFEILDRMHNNKDLEVFDSLDNCLMRKIKKDKVIERNLPLRDKDIVVIVPLEIESKVIKNKEKKNNEKRIIGFIFILIEIKFILNSYNRHTDRYYIES